MAPLPVIDNCCRVAFRWRYAGSGTEAVNVMHFAAEAGDLAALNSHITARVNANMWVATKSTAVIYELVMTPLDGSSASVTFPTDLSAKWSGGTATGDAIPQVAMIVKLLTAKRGRSYRGRVFVPFIAEGSVADGTIASSAVTSGQTAWNNFASGMSTDLDPLLVASYKHATSEQVTSQTVEPLCGTQRRRQPRPK